MSAQREHTGRFAYVGLGAAFAALLGITGVFYWSIVQLQEDFQWVSLSENVLYNLSGTLGHLTDAETAQRGYLVTGEERHLESYRLAESHFKDGKTSRHIVALRELTKDDPAKQERVNALERLAKKRLTRLAGTIALRRDKGPEAARAAVLTDEGKALMDDIRDVITEMQEEEQQLLQRRQAQQEARLRATFIALGAGALMILLTSGLVIWRTNRDITERKRAKKEIESLARFTSENPYPVVRIAADGEVLYANYAATGLLKDLKPGLGRPPPEDWRRIGAEALESRDIVRTEVEHEGRILLIWAAPVADAGYVNLYGLDVTEARKAEQEIENLARFPAENPDPVLRVSGDGTLIFANRAAKPLLDAWSCRTEQKIPQQWAEVSAKALVTGCRQDAEVECDVRVLSLTFAPVVESGYVNLYGHDITERKEAQEALQEAHNELEQRVKQRTAALATANKELESFSYSVSHDLRAPLRGIAGFTHALKEDYANGLDAEGRDHLDRVLKASARMTQLIDDLLRLSGVTLQEMKREMVDLSALARSIAGEYQKAEPTRRVRFIIEPRLTAQGDPSLLRLALQNLLDNAWKFTGGPDRARIEFGTVEHEGGRAYFVRDDGVGFDMGYVHKLFIPFQRLHPQAEFSGTGIGLATVSRVIARHGGKVWAQGQVDKGATFYFTL